LLLDGLGVGRHRRLAGERFFALLILRQRRD
jgi:hypothetical protein